MSYLSHPKLVQLLSLLAFSLCHPLSAEGSPFISEVEKLAGCFLVDYSYSETESLDPEYVLDSRVYDVKKYTVKELIRIVKRDETHVRLQHFMQAEDFSGNTLFMMRHHGEIWRKNPAYTYRYLGPLEGQSRWEIEDLDRSENIWMREITNLDDGPRYQCLGKWSKHHTYPEFKCSAFAPIPGREIRDMGRYDYNTMERQSSIQIYGNSWLERQDNIKVKFSQSETQPLAKEVGKIWSVRLPDEECTDVRSWSDERQAFWDILAEVWQEIYLEKQDFYEKKFIDGSTRSQKITELLARYYKTVKSNKEHASVVRNAIRNIIKAHRK